MHGNAICEGVCGDEAQPQCPRTVHQGRALQDSPSLIPLHSALPGQIPLPALPPTSSPWPCLQPPGHVQGITSICTGPPCLPPPSRPSRHLGLVVHLQGTAAADARLAPPASHHSGMAGHTAACSENALGSVPVSRVVVGAVAAVSSVGTEGGMGVHTTQYVQR